MKRKNYSFLIHLVVLSLQKENDQLMYIHNTARVILSAAALGTSKCKGHLSLQHEKLPGAMAPYSRRPQHNDTTMAQTSGATATNGVQGNGWGDNPRKSLHYELIN